MENERQLLGMYVNVGEYRRNISMPFRQDGRICATDGHSLALLFDMEGKDIEILVMPMIRDEKVEEIKIETI